ncbi:girdin-like isoform X3 [Ostrea edulis]|uniref:girdin-like isoform X3 n=1 Tax=Ostrea edulis TaxID=37623 RepID=UPI002095054E|nr:girdin-like isoform X3 [Ostrea edulis]
MAAGVNFMETPLVLWVETFRNGRTLEFKDLCDGVFLNDVMLQIDPRPINYQNVNRAVEDVNIQLHNWEILVRNIRAYYVDVLQQLLILKLPNYQTICREPDKDVSLSEMKKALLLILGCAVQCERKEYFIDKIKELDVDVQTAIVEYIKEITDDSESILPIEPLEQLETYAEKMFKHLARVIKERDDFSEVSVELAQERDFFQTQLQCCIQGTPVPVTPPASPEKHHLVVELADSKAKIRRLRQDLEDKQEVLSDMRDELEENKAVVTKLRNENSELIQDARTARSLRDELDVLREKLGKADGYQNEILKYKEKLNELEFYKTRVDELREDNTILIETKNMLEEQLSNCHKRVETVVELENELRKKRQMVEEMALERDTDREKLRILTEENAQLQYEKKSSLNESTNLENELDSARLRIMGMGGSLSAQLTETTNAKILRLELENQRLNQKLEEAKEKMLIENAERNLELEKENQRLAKKVEKLLETNQETSQNCLEMEQKMEHLELEKENLIQTLDTVKENSERQVKELERENDQLTHTVEVVRARSEQTNDARLKDLERENKRMSQSVSQKDQRLSKVEYDNRQLLKSYNSLKHNCDRISDLETENVNLEKENNEMHKVISTLKLTCDKYETLEQENSDLDVENRKLQKAVESLNVQLQKKEILEQDVINLRVENQKLHRSLDTSKNSSLRIAEVENEKDALNRELQHLKKSLEVQKNLRTKQEQMELDLLDLDNENQRVQKSLEITTKRVQQLEKDNSDLEMETEKLQKTIEKMKISNKRLLETEKQVSELEEEVRKLNKEKSALEKEKKRVKQTLDLKESVFDDISAKYSALDREHKSVKKSLESQKDMVTHTRELEKENREVKQQCGMHQRTLATLREDLVNEKIKSQNLSNDFDKLTQELERVGINKEKLVMADHRQDENRYKALESMMEEALKKSMEIKEEKIHALESRLEESKSRNLKLQEEMRLLKRECESLKQRYEEESHGRESERRETVGLLRGAPPYHRSNSQNTTKDILELKDHLVQVERANATMMAENKNMKSQTNALNEQLKKLESQNSKLQSENSSLQSQGHSLQSTNAKLQVENSTLNSHCSSLKGQNSNLQSHINQLQSEHQHLIQTHDELQSSHEQLAQDHEELQKIHDQLTADYEALISEHGSLKSIHKAIKNENKELHEQLTRSVHGKDQLNQMQMELKSMRNLQEENTSLRSEHDRMAGQYEKLRTDYRDLLADHKRVKNEFNQAQLRNTDLQGQCGEMKDQLHSMELEINGLAHKYDTLYQVNQKMEEDNKNLLMQIQALLNSNQDLLSQILNSKEQFNEEEKSYLEKMNDLKRQKERLEEKIMEHYKRQDNQKKNRGLGARIVRKAARIFATKHPRSKSRTNLAESTGENSLLGDTTDSRPELRSSRPASMWNLTDEPSLAKQNSSLAKSASALNQSDKTAEGASLSSRGLGHPAVLGDDDDDGGFGTNEMLTLEEFLHEANKGSSKTAKSVESRSQEDTESKSSENSDNSGKRNFRKRQAPAPPLHLSTPPQSGSNPRISSSIPDVAAVSSHLDLSRMSRISGGSSGSGHDSRTEEYPTPPHSIRGHPETSTPAVSSGSNIRLNNGSFEDLNHCSPLLSSGDRYTASSTPSTASRTLHYSFGNSPQSQNYSGHSTHSRELPPTPGNISDRTTASDRLDRLVSSNLQSSSPHNNYDMSVRSGIGHERSGQNLSDKPPPARGNTPQGSHNRPQNSTPQGSHSRPQNFHSSGKLGHSPHTQYRPQQNPYSSFPGPIHNGPHQPSQGYPNSDSVKNPSNSDNNRRLSMHDTNSQQNIYSSIDDTRSRAYDAPQNNFSSSGNLANGPLRNSASDDNHYARIQRIERPKSVPPSMFNQLQQSPTKNTSDNVYSQPNKTPPVPPPRRARDSTATTRLIREPSQNQVSQGRHILASRNSTPPSGSTRQLPQGGLTRSQTAMGGRIGPPLKPVNNTPPAPKVLNNEPKDPKENSVWYEYGCV